jgi:hypothetical protein
MPTQRAVTAPPRIRPISTREYGKVSRYLPQYQAGGEVTTPTAEEMAHETTRQLSPSFWANMGKPKLPPTHPSFNWKTGQFE